MRNGSANPEIWLPSMERACPAHKGTKSRLNKSVFKGDFGNSNSPYKSTTAGQALLFVSYWGEFASFRQTHANTNNRSSGLWGESGICRAQRGYLPSLEGV